MGDVSGMREGPFTVTVSDGSGGEATVRFSVTISEVPSQGVRPR
jgi:hypothetical protein